MARENTYTSRRPSFAVLLAALSFVIVGTVSASLIWISYVESTTSSRELAESTYGGMMTRVYASSQQLMDSSAIVCNCLHAFFPATYILHENYTGSGREIPIVKLMKVLKDQFPAITSVGFDSPHGAMLLITRFGHEVIVTDDSRTEDEHLDLYTLDKELYTAGRLLASPEIDHAQFLTRTVAPKLSMPALLPASTLRIRDTPSSEIRTVITYQAVYPVFNASGHFHIPMSERGILLIFEPSGNIIACNKADSRSAVGTGIVQVKDSPDPIIAGML